MPPLAAIFLTLASVLLYAGVDTIGWAVTLMITALATLASALNFCVGCEMYMLLARLRGARRVASAPFTSAFFLAASPIPISPQSEDMQPLK